MSDDKWIEYSNGSKIDDLTEIRLYDSEEEGLVAVLRYLDGFFIKLTDMYLFGGPSENKIDTLYSHGAWVYGNQQSEIIGKCKLVLV